MATQERVIDVPKPVERVEAHSTGIDAQTMAAIDQMPVNELRALIRRVSGAMWGYAAMSKEEKRESLRLKIYAIAMGSGQDAVTLKAANDWLDREEGKATQRVETKALIATVDMTAHREAVHQKALEYMSKLACATSISGNEVTKNK